ncbi:nuclear pore complex protein NUP205 isoform X2, partial [Tanacetum coccineum]
AVHFFTYYAPLWGAILFNGIVYFQVICMLNNVTRMTVGMSDRGSQSDTRADIKECVRKSNSITQCDVLTIMGYLGCLRDVHPKVGSSSLVSSTLCSQRKTWFPDIEPLFKLSYENAPPYLKGALRDSIATFIHVSPILKDTIWGFFEQYDLPVVVYDMRFELNEVKARSEHYPSTISFLNLLNSLIAEERDATDRGRRILSMYDIKEEDIDLVASQSQLSTPQSTPLQMQLPVVELLKGLYEWEDCDASMSRYSNPGLGEGFLGF